MKLHLTFPLEPGPARPDHRVGDTLYVEAVLPKPRALPGMAAVDCTEAAKRAAYTMIRGYAAQGTPVNHPSCGVLLDAEVRDGCLMVTLEPTEDWRRRHCDEQHWRAEAAREDERVRRQIEEVVASNRETSWWRKLWSR